jgi:hypothetical protein
MAARSVGIGKGWLVGAGTMFWVLVFAGIATANGAVIGAAVVLALVTAGIVITKALRTGTARKAEQDRVWAVGTPGRAQVVSIKPSGARLNGHPMIDIVLDLTVADRPAGRFSARTLISELAIPRVQPGCEIDVRVDPADEANIVLDPALSPFG